MSSLPNALRSERGEALLHGLHLLQETWHGLDTPRSGHPEVSRETLDLVATSLPSEGEGVRRALDAAALVLDESLSQSRPRYFGYIASSGLESSVLADAMATSHDVNLAAESAAAYLVEQQALRWVGELVGFPVDGGMFTSGGMVSNLTALTAARTRALPESRRTGVMTKCAVYASADSHSSIERAVEVLGMGREQFRPIPVDDRRRMDVLALATAITSDVAEGVVPVAVVATAGTTLTGAVDPINTIADVCAEHGVWLHIDGAYGLPAAGSPLTRELFTGLDRADSASVDAHKWMYVPKACGVLMVKDAKTLRAAFAHHAAYMVEEEGFFHPVDTTLEYSRPFRSLKLWVALRAHGATAFIDAISENIELARYLMKLVAAHPRMQPVLEAPDLSTVPFRRIPATGDTDEHNRQLARAMQTDGRVYVTSAVIDGRTCLRPCFVNFRTTREDVDALVEVADELGARLEAS